MIDCSAQVIYWRAAASIAWAVLLLPLFTAAFVLFSRFSLFHPIQTLSGQSLLNCYSLLLEVDWSFMSWSHTECLDFLTSASAIFSLILLSGVMVILGFLNLEYYTGKRDYVWHYRCTILTSNIYFDWPHPWIQLYLKLTVCIHWTLLHKTIADLCLRDLQLFFSHRDGTIQTAFSWKRANNLTVFYTQVLFWNCISFFFLHPSSCPNYCVLKNWIVGSVAASPSACQFVGLLHHGSDRGLVLCYHNWLQIWYTGLHVSREWWVSS